MMATKAKPCLHDRARLRREVAGVPAGAIGSIVQVFADDVFGVELDDPDLTEHLDGIIDVPADALDVAVHPGGRESGDIARKSR